MGFFLLPIVSMAEFEQPDLLLQLLKGGIGMHGELATTEVEEGLGVREEKKIKVRGEASVLAETADIGLTFFLLPSPIFFQKTEDRLV